MKHRSVPEIPLEVLAGTGFPLDFIEDQAANETFHWGKNDPTEPYSGVTALFDADRHTRLGPQSERIEWIVLDGLEIAWQPLDQQNSQK